MQLWAMMYAHKDSASTGTNQFPSGPMTMGYGRPKPALSSEAEAKATAWATGYG